MANNAGQGGQQQVMYYYMVAPQGNQYVQGDGTMNPQGGFDQSAAIQSFVPNQQGYGYPDQGDSNSMGGMGMQMAHNMQPNMMQAGQQGVMPGQSQQMVMMTMVPQAQQQAQMAAEQTPDQGQQTSWGAMAQGPPQAPHEQPPPASPPSSAARTGAPVSKAFKIIDPTTKQSIQAANEGHGAGGPAPGRTGHDMGSGAPAGQQQQGQQPQQPQPQPQQQQQHHQQHLLPHSLSYLGKNAS